MNRKRNNAMIPPVQDKPQRRRRSPRPAQSPRVPFQRFRSQGWVVTWCILGGIAMVVGVVLAFAH
jgi:hypothetical protein